ncbi:MAG: ABC transporter ATP-binding protein [Thermomicrobiales bacterium]|nr:ABC transporter ATP-binding protein [Thermomicrobiales bacterium]
MKSEFSIEGRYGSGSTSPARWVLSHIRRNWIFVLASIGGIVLHTVLNSMVPVLTGQAFNAVLETPPDKRELGVIALLLLGLVLTRGAFDLMGSLSSEVIAKRLERDARDELYISLLGKSQTFHNRQSVGDLMARAANDVRQLNTMVNPGLSLIIDSFTGLVIPIVFIGLIDWRLLGPPLVFTFFFLIALRYYMRQLNPVSNEMRRAFGSLNSELQESITGIEVIKSTAQEAQEEAKFENRACAYRNAMVRQGAIQARYIPTLLLAVANAAAFLLGLYLVSKDEISIGTLVTYFGLMFMLRFPTFISIFTFSLVQIGLASAQRIIDLINEETELDQNAGGIDQTIAGDLVFENVSLAYDGDPVLKNVSFHVHPGETVAIVGETGSGKSTLTKLVNRIYDVDAGRVLIDGIDVRDWNLDALRSQISTIEQDIVLFSRPVTENIGFSLGQQTNREEVERAARDAQADSFIRQLPDGYDTVIGERGVTLSGGQRQRLAIARALITDPRILMIDDSTSAIDSATEDQIQRAIRRVLEGRTTLLITHRLSQIRWADKIVVLRKGELVDFGTHDELIERCPLYRRIFTHYDDESVVPAPLQESPA